MRETDFGFNASISYWEIRQFLTDIDLLVVGSGIVGLTTAIYFKKAHPTSRVVVVEKGFLPSGASTKNAGFTCFGSLSEILSDLKNSSEDEVFDLISKRVTGLSELRQLIGDRKLGYKPCGGYEIFRPQDEELLERCLDFLPRANQRLKDDLNLTETYSVAADEIHRSGFAGVSNMIRNQHEGSLDTGRMMYELIQIAGSMGITILNSLEVDDWAEADNSAEISFKNGLSVSARKLHFATNGFACQLLPDLDVEPARAQVLITEPVPDLRINGTFHMDEGYYYFRNVGNRVLLGGGRNLDFEAETTSELATSYAVQQKLDDLLAEMILPSTSFTVEHRWAGIMGVGKVKKAIVEQISDHVSCAVRLGGMGVAIGTLIGKESVELLG